MTTTDPSKLATSYYYLTQSTFGIPASETIVDVSVTSKGIYIVTVKPDA
jgi:hypothetical protein